MGALEDADDDDDRIEDKRFSLDIRSIPCLRETFLTSISSGLVASFAYFMFTSKTRRAVQVGYGTFFGVTTCFWIYCRYKHASDKLMALKTMTAIAEADKIARAGRQRPAFGDDNSELVNDA